MKIRYDPEVDAMVIRFRETMVEESDEISPNVIADFDADGEVVGIEILSASRLVDNPTGVSLDVLVPVPSRARDRVPAPGDRR